MRRIGGCALLALGLAAPAWGQFDDADAEAPRVLTPARLDQPVSEVPASVTVIDRELILASGAREARAARGPARAPAPARPAMWAGLGPVHGPASSAAGRAAGPLPVPRPGRFLAELHTWWTDGRKIK